jgi:DNA repair exonuclease SbcCD nuclease subunit
VLINEIEQHGPLLFSPFLFREEYAALAATIEAKRAKYVFGHFEFRNFVVTGSDRKMEHGPDHTQFSSPKYIFSGHYHKRQALDNVIYIGNTFPTNYGDAWDDARGMALLDTDTDEVDFIDWDACPKYRKIKLSSILENPSVAFDSKTRVRCIVDIDIAYSEAQDIKQEILNSFNLREFSLEENLNEKKDALSGDESFADLEFSTLNDAVIGMLKTGITGTTSIDPSRLIEIYQQL